MRFESTLQEAIGVYLTRRRALGFAENTVKNDGSTLHRLDWFLNEPDVEDITHEDMVRFLAAVGANIKPGTFNMLVNRISKFLKFCRENGYADADFNPMGEMRPRRVPRQEHRRIPLSEFGEFLNRAANPRDRIVLALGLYLFLRQSEIVALQMKHLDMVQKQIEVTIFKTCDSDVMPICSELHLELKRWLIHYKEVVGPLLPEMHLTPAMWPMPVEGQLYKPYQRITRTEDIVHRTLNNYGWTYLEQKGQGVHLLRRSGARALFDELDSHSTDGALRIVQSHLHHKSSVMTERYLGITADRAKRDRILRGQPMFRSLIQEETLQRHGLSLVT
jgi:integrase